MSKQRFYVIPIPDDTASEMDIERGLRINGVRFVVKEYDSDDELEKLVIDLTVAAQQWNKGAGAMPPQVKKARTVLIDYVNRKIDNYKSVADVGKAFHDLAVKERDHARFRVGRLQAENDELRELFEEINSQEAQWKQAIKVAVRNCLDVIDGNKEGLDVKFVRIAAETILTDWK